MSAATDLTGKKFGRLTALNRTESNKKGGAMWLCECECGEKVVANATNLRNGHTKSCGCFKAETSSKAHMKHGMCHSRLHRIWGAMQYRCGNPNCSEYKNYGGRGISVCKEWKEDFLNFYNWAMSNGYADDLTIDRIDVNGNYCPENCRWATLKEQQSNRRNSKRNNMEGVKQIDSV